MRKNEASEGRSLVSAFADHGMEWPHQVTAPAPPADDVSWPSLRNHHGPWGKGRGWAAAPHAPLRVYRATTHEIGSVFPFLTDKPLPRSGAQVGINRRSGSGFYFDMRTLILRGVVSNSNALITGKAGNGKSGVAKALLNRAMCYGDRVLLLGDLKDEYSQVCEAWGNPAIALAPGQLARINPMDPGPLAWGWDSLTEDQRRSRFEMMRSRWLSLLPGLLDSVNVRIDETGRETLGAVLDDLVGANRGQLLTPPNLIIPDIYHAMSNPSEDLWRRRRFSSAQAFLDTSRPVIDGLGLLIRGLRGMFDTHTNIDVDWNAPIVSLALRDMIRYGDAAVGVALTCVSSWASTQTAMVQNTERGEGEFQPIRWNVHDEAWRQLRMGPGAVLSLDADLRLKRNDVEANLLITHKPSDMAAAGDKGSRESQLAEEMAALCDTKIMLAQDSDVAEKQGEALGLSELEVDLIKNWAWGEKGRALWRVGSASYKVQTLWHPWEKPMFETNSAWDAHKGVDEAKLWGIAA